MARVPRRRPPDARRARSRAPASVPPPQTAQAPKLSDERLNEAVCEAVFCYQLQQPLADAPHPARCYVARQGRDADDACLGRLRALVSEVQPPSQCRVTAREEVVDRAIGARGAIVQVARLAWGHAAAVDVVG
jgi:hypothetical protein